MTCALLAMVWLLVSPSLLLVMLNELDRPAGCRFSVCGFQWAWAVAGPHGLGGLGVHLGLRGQRRQL